MTRVNLWRSIKLAIIGNLWLRLGTEFACAESAHNSPHNCAKHYPLTGPLCA
jgi:hypothetical protein